MKEKKVKDHEGVTTDYRGHSNPPLPPEKIDMRTKSDTVEVINGISQREYFAAMAMQGMAANGWLNNGEYIEEVAFSCAQAADALIKALDK